jgi:uncharacterized cupin superfamily protein
MPLHIVTASPSTIELEPSSLPREWVLEGNPQVRAKEIARSDDASMSMIVWSCTEGRFRWHYGVDETVHILSGEVIVTDDDSKEHRLGPGDSAFFPAGTTSVWHVTQAMRKVAVCRATVPRVVSLGLRAWNWGKRRAKTLFAAGAATTSSRGNGLVQGPSNEGSLV